MSYPYTLDDLRTMLETRILEYSSTLFSDAELNRALNDGQMDVASKGLCIEAIMPWTTTASTRTIDLTAIPVLLADDGITVLTDDAGTTTLTGDTAVDSCIKVLGVEYVPTSGTAHGLLPITPQQLGHIPTRTVEPEYFFRWGKYIGFEPKPGNTTYNINIYVAQPPSCFMDTGYVPQVPYAYAQLLVDYGLFRCLLKLRKFSAALEAYNQYISEVSKLRTTITQKYAGTAEDMLLPDQVVGK